MSEVMIPLCCLSQRSCILHQSSHNGWMVIGVEDKKKRRSRAYKSTADLFKAWAPPSLCTSHTPYLGWYLTGYNEAAARSHT